MISQMRNNKSLHTRIIRHTVFAFLCISFILVSVTCKKTEESRSADQPVHTDKPFWQDYSIKYAVDQEDTELRQVYRDRNGVVQVLSSRGLLHPHNGRFLYPGALITDRRYRFMKDKKLAALGLHRQQLVYLADQAVLGNAWAGKLFSRHGLPGARLFAGGEDFSFLVSDGKSLRLIRDSLNLWEGRLADDEVTGIRSGKGEKGLFWILGKRALYTFSPRDKKLEKVLEGKGFTSFDLSGDGQKVFIGTNNGYVEFDARTRRQLGGVRRELPCTEITAVAMVGERLWLGSARGAFALREDGGFDYYAGKRWLPGDRVVHISPGKRTKQPRVPGAGSGDAPKDRKPGAGRSLKTALADPDHSVLILTTGGLGEICFRQMTLEDKAAFFEEQVRTRHIRNGFNATLNGMENGDIGTGYMKDSDNDGLWTSLYLAGQAFRYAATGEDEALQNCRESLDAMERLYTINPVPGFPSRSFERSGHIDELSDPERWQHSRDPEWDWKATTSSDEAIGHIFAFGVLAELVEDAGLKDRAVRLIDTLMGHILANDLYLVDYDGKPTQWGRWNPDYVNAFPVSVGDRKLNASNIIGMLQTAWHFTGKEKYKDKAFELMEKHGYLENLMRPMSEIGPAAGKSVDLSVRLSEAWNHSDDEMYFAGYWGLYRYAFSDSLKSIYKKSILDHWQAERPEKEGAWNIFTAITGAGEFDLEEAVWYLQQYPLDLISWDVTNSHRKDIELLEPNFRSQTTREVLPPDELRIARHNANRFILDGGRGGNSEYSAGDIWLFPYWMGRYLGVID